MSVSDISDDLYGLLPSEFTAARNKAAAAAGVERPAVMALRKPSPAAWVVNLLVRQRGDQVDSVLELGEQLREAQHDLDRAALAELTQQRRQLVGALAKQGAALANVAGHRVGPAVIDEVAQTLQAAMADADAADAVRSGRLIRSLEVNGLTVDLEGAVAGDASPPARRREPLVDDLEEKRAQKRREAAERQKALEAAESAHEKAERVVADATRKRDALADSIDDLKSRLAALKTQLAAADKELKTAAAQRDAAAEAAAKLR